MGLDLDTPNSEELYGCDISAASLSDRYNNKPFLVGMNRALPSVGMGGAGGS